VCRTGRDLTLVTWSKALHAALAAAEHAAARGRDVEVIDLRTLWPWDRETVLASAARTGRLLAVHEAVEVAGFGAEIVATAAEALRIPVARLGGPRIPVGYASSLEAEARITPAAILDKLESLFA
jgi:acetoin:2,6-dichlorophenolindophenol oxidoreductase subunit beta